MRIGDFSRLSHVPVKTLRHYHAIGLLHPTHVDPLTRYRYYSGDQFEELNRILVFKDLGFALRDIRMLIVENVPARQLRELLRRRRDDLERSVDRERARLARIEARLELLERSGDRGPYVALRDTSPRVVASVRGWLTSHEECERLFEEIDHVCGGARRRVRGAIWHSCAKGKIDCEAFVVEPHLHQGSRDRLKRRNRVRMQELPPCRVASLVYRGDHDYLSAYSALRGWIAASGLAARGPKREIFLAEKSESTESVTELQFPVIGERDRLQECD